MRLIEHKILVPLFLFLLSFGVFVPSLKNGFVWDDHMLIKERYQSRDIVNMISGKIIPHIRETGRGYHYRPILHSSLAMDNRLWGHNPGGYHLSNIILYSISTVLFYFLALIVLGEFRINGKENIAFLSSLLFALFPMHVEAVSFISGRMDLLCGIFFFLAFIFHVISYRKLWFLILTAISFYLSLLSKEIAVVFPIVVLGFDIISRRFKSPSNIFRYFVYAALLILYFYLRARAYETVPELPALLKPPAEALPPTEVVQKPIHWVYQALEVLRVFLSSYLFYIKKLFFPYDLNAFIATVPMGFYHLISSILVILLLCFISLISILKRGGIIAFSIYWVFVNLGPVSLVPIFVIAMAPLAERYLYIPSAGYCLLIGYLILEGARLINVKKMGWVLGFILCLTYLFFSIDRQRVWKDDLALWEDASKKSPYHAIPHANYAEALTIAGKDDEAIREYLIALKPSVKVSKSERAIIANKLVSVYLKKEDYEDAEKWLHKALNYDSEYVSTYYNLGYLYFMKGQLRNSASDHRLAEKYLKKALEIEPRNREVHILLSYVYLIGLGDSEKAREHSKKAEGLKR
jgi:protein O-mannosyl-transferase